ncbi:MAG TPA: ABC transporter substrate-binding protein [Hyphomicrobiaceae bacterium]|nr:ABC transporter substrate-binding protein [Hyphomicrobiaceae bacterium]
MARARNAVRFFALAMAGVLVSAVAPTSTVAEEPRRGGTLVYAVLGDPPTIDCHAASSFASMHYIAPHYSLLIKVDPQDPSKVAPDIAESWTEAPDRLSYTFKLRPGVIFHDGSPLTSADVKASFDRIRNPPDGVLSVRKSVYARIADIETPDPLTVVFRLKTPSPAFLLTVANPFNCLYSAAKLRQNPNYPADEVMGSGPFTFVERVRGGQWVGKRFDGYFDKPRPYLDGFRAVNTSPQALATALQSGQVMTQFRTLSPAIRDRLKEAMGDQLRVYTRVYDFLVVVAFNTKRPAFSDARVRKALSLAIDRWGGAQALSKVSSLAFVGTTQRPESPWAPSESELVSYPGFGKDIAAARAEAKRLLKEAGHETLSLKLVNRNIPDPYTSAGVYLVDQWRQVGVTTEHQQVDVGALTNAMRSGEFDAIIDFLGEGVDDPSITLARNVSADISSYNPSGFIDRTIDDLYRKIDSEFDPAARKKLVAEFETRFLSEAYQVPFLWLNRTVTMPPKVRGFIMTPSHFLNQDLAGLWLAE